MKILLTYLYDLGKDFRLHRAIHSLCSASYERNLLDVEELRVLKGEAHDYSDMLIEVFAAARTIWEAGNDVLLVDGDTLCVKPTRMFDLGDRLTMFNMACASVPYDTFPKDAYIHSAVRLLPQTMNSGLWKLGQALMDVYDREMWAYDQYVWNSMFWAQPGLSFDCAKTYVNPLYCYVPLPQYDNFGLAKKDAYIIHYCNSRGTRRCLERMREDTGG